MTHTDHIALIKNGVEDKDKTWADFGSGDGAFTLALREVIGIKANLYSIDSNALRLRVQENKFNQMFPGSTVHYLNYNFQDELPLPPLDGILMANSIHYVKEKVPFLEFIKLYLKPKGKLLLVEYNTNTGNVWVPFPISFDDFKVAANEAGFTTPVLLNTIPSEFLRQIYSTITYINK